jgi:hypothetical protein
MVQVMMQEEKDILLAIINWELTAIKIIQGSTLRSQQKANYHRYHENMKFFILVDWSHRSLFQIISFNIVIVVL